MKKEPLSRKLTFGIFYLLSSSFITISINVLTIAFIARTLGVDNFGLYSAILSFVGLFQFLSDFGLNKTLLKFGSKDRDKAQVSFGNALLIKSLLIIPTLLLINLFGFLAGYRNEQLMVMELFAISLILDSYATVFSGVRRILGSFKLISFFRVFKTGINLVVIIVALSINNSVLYLAFATALLSFIAFVISLINTVLILKPKLKITLIKEFLKDSLLFSLNDFFLNIYGRMSTVLLSFFHSFHIVGIYSAALKFTKIANLLPNQVKIALLPTMYRILDNERIDEQNINKVKSKKVFLILLKYLAILATPLAISIYFFSDPIIHLVFGRKYDNSIPLVKLFSLFIYLRFIETPFTLFYMALHKHKTMVTFQGITSFLNLILNLILIPRFSVYGACFATLFSEICLGLMLILKGGKFSIWLFKDVLGILLRLWAAALLSLALNNILFNGINVVIQLLILIALYLLFLFLFKSFNKQDKDLFLKIFAKKKHDDMIM